VFKFKFKKKKKKKKKESKAAKIKSNQAQPTSSRARFLNVILEIRPVGKPESYAEVIKNDWHALT
jgi:hypothetical protein